MSDASRTRPSARRGTADEAEVARFAALAEKWWDPDGEFQPLHRLNPTRIRFIRDRVCAHLGRDPMSARPLSGLTLLDIGCGGGLISEPMARLGATVTGIDAEARSIGVATTHAEQVGLPITYRNALPEDLAAEGLVFDVVLNMEVVEHVADVDAFVGASAALLKSGGPTVVATLNRTLRSLALGKIAAEYILRWLPAGTHDWRKFVRPDELRDALGRHGLAVRDMRGMAYNPLTDAWSLSRDLSVNYLTFAVKR